MKLYVHYEEPAAAAAAAEGGDDGNGDAPLPPPPLPPPPPQQQQQQQQQDKDSNALTLKLTLPKKWRGEPLKQVLDLFLQSYNAKKKPLTPLEAAGVHMEKAGCVAERVRVYVGGCMCRATHVLEFKRTPTVLLCLVGAR